MDYLKIMGEIDEKVAIAHRLVQDVNAIKKNYTPLMFERMHAEINCFSTSNVHYSSKEKEQNSSTVITLVQDDIKQTFLFGIK